MPSPADSSPWDRLGTIVLVGHRGAGKSTLGRMVAARFQRPFIDLDDELARRLQRSPADVISTDLEAFRRHERQTLAELARRRPAPIVACGAGVDTLPSGCFVVWIDRDDWRREVRRSNRPRVRPELSESAEWDWMETTRPPLWLDRAHLRLTIPRGRTVDDSAAQLQSMLGWAERAPRNSVTQNTWLVPSCTGDLMRAFDDARQLGGAGIELRSDVFSTPPAVPDSTRYIASLRHDDPKWLDNYPRAAIWDIDLQFLDSVADVSLKHRPRRLVVSTHPEGVDSAHFDALQAGARRLSEALDISPKAIGLKYVPTITGFDELNQFFDLVSRFRSSPYSTTLLTTSRRFAWIRPILARNNALNYLPVGLSERCLGHPSPVDLDSFLPHLAGGFPRRFDALVGDPVEHSRGDLWHRRSALRDGNDDIGYLKIPVARDELDDALPVLRDLPIRGLSVTSPLKREAASSHFVENPDKLPALNTLVQTPGADFDFRGIDTDAEGMSRTLEYIESRDIGPGDAVVFGRGGASHAVVRALRDSGWRLVEHISARNGWRPEHARLSTVDLIVNAAGPQSLPGDFTPNTNAWLDLHYTGVAPYPDGDVLAVQGDLFFVAQARAQRRFWAKAPSDDAE